MWSILPRQKTGLALAAWRIANKSNIDLYDIQYQFGLFDLDQPFLVRDPNFPDTPFTPLQIPVAKIDFINAGDFRSGIVLPQGLLTQVRAGDRLFGMASFSCPKCDEKGYWVMIVHRHGGWFAPMKGSWRGMSLPLGAISANPKEELDKLVPPASRIEIH